MNIIPIKRRLLRLATFWHHPTYQSVCERAWDLNPPPVERKGYRAIYLEGQLDRVEGVDKTSSSELEAIRVNGQWREYRPTRAYLIKNAILANGFLYKKALKSPLIPDKEKLILSGNFEEIDEALLSTNYVSNRYFGHFIYDELPLTMLAEQFGGGIINERDPYAHEAEYRDLLQLHARSVNIARIKKLFVVEDFPWNDSKVARVREIRAKLRSVLGEANPPGIYYRRGQSGSLRYLVNESEVEAFLQKRGFVIVDPQTQSATEILELGIGANIAVGVEGSQMAPGILSVNDQGAFLALQPPTRFNNHSKDRTDALGMAYGFIVGLREKKGFRIDIEELARTLDLMDTKIDSLII